jgi:Tyrosine phosphatase family
MCTSIGFTVLSFHFDNSLRSCRLGLQTIVSIVPQAPLQDLVDFCEQQHIVLIPISAEKYKEEGMPITSAQVAQVYQHV